MSRSPMVSLARAAVMSRSPVVSFARAAVITWLAWPEMARAGELARAGETVARPCAADLPPGGVRYAVARQRLRPAGDARLCKSLRGLRKVDAVWKAGAVGWRRRPAKHVDRG